MPDVNQVWLGQMLHLQTLHTTFFCILSLQNVRLRLPCLSHCRALVGPLGKWKAYGRMCYCEMVLCAEPRHRWSTAVICGKVMQRSGVKLYHRVQVDEIRAWPVLVHNSTSVRTLFTPGMYCTSKSNSEIFSSHHKTEFRFVSAHVSSVQTFSYNLHSAHSSDAAPMVWPNADLPDVHADDQSLDHAEDSLGSLHTGITASSQNSGSSSA